MCSIPVVTFSIASHRIGARRTALWHRQRKSSTLGQENTTPVVFSRIVFDVEFMIQRHGHSRKTRKPVRVYMYKYMDMDMEMYLYMCVHIQYVYVCTYTVRIPDM